MYAFLLPGLGAVTLWFDNPFLTKQPMELSALHSSVATATDREWVSQSCHVNPQRFAVWASPVKGCLNESGLPLRVVETM